MQQNEDEEENSVIEMKIFHSGQFEMEIERDEWNDDDFLWLEREKMLQTCLQFP